MRKNLSEWLLVWPPQQYLVCFLVPAPNHAFLEPLSGGHGGWRLDTAGRADPS